METETLSKETVEVELYKVIMKNFKHKNRIVE